MINTKQTAPAQDSFLATAQASLLATDNAIVGGITGRHRQRAGQ